MASYDLIDAFDDCITRLQSGQSVEDCLRIYHQYAVQLRPMLETGLAVRRATPIVSSAARARVRARVMPAGRSQRVPWRSSQLILVGAAILVVVFAASLIVLRDREHYGLTTERIQASATDLPVATLTAGPTQSPMITPTPSSTMPTSPTLTVPTLTARPTQSPTITPTPSSTMPTSPTLTVPTLTARPTQSPTITPTPSSTMPTSPTLTVPTLTARPTQSPMITPTPSSTMPTSPTLTVPTTPAPTCRFRVTSISANLRLGPGMGYAVVGFAYADDIFTVLALHTSGAWLEIAWDDSSVWLATSVGELSDNCADLPESDEAFLDDGSVSMTATPARDQDGENSSVPDSSDNSHDDSESRDDNEDDADDG